MSTSKIGTFREWLREGTSDNGKLEKIVKNIQEVLKTENIQYDIEFNTKSYTSDKGSHGILFTYSINNIKALQVSLGFRNSMNSYVLVVSFIGDSLDDSIKNKIKNVCNKILKFKENNIEQLVAANLNISKLKLDNTYKKIILNYKSFKPEEYNSKIITLVECIESTIS